MTAFVICVGSSLLSKTVDVTLILHIMPYIINITVQHEGRLSQSLQTQQLTLPVISL